MKLKTILKTVGKGLLSQHPLGAAAMAVIGAGLPGNQQLPDDITGEGAQAALNNLPLDQRVAIMEQELKLEIAREEGWTDRFEAMTKVSGWGWVRPFIALQMSVLISVGVGGFLYILWEAVQKAESANLSGVVASVGALWPAIAAALGVPTTIVLSWFGHRERAKQRQAEVMNKQNVSPIQGVVSTIIQSLRK